MVGVDFDYVYDGKLGTDVLRKPSILTPAISDFMSIRQNARYKEQIPLLTPFQKKVKAYAACGGAFGTGNDIVNTTLELTELSIALEWCKDEFVGTLKVGNNLAEEFLKTGQDEFNPDGTQVQTIINEQVNDAMRLDTFRIFSFGDTGGASADYNMLDGMWTQLIAGVAASCVNRTSTFTYGVALADGEALAACKAAYEGSAIILKQLPKSMKYIAVTGAVYENLLSSYESNTTGSDLQFTNLTNGQGESEANLSYRGIKVVPVYAWDDSLADTDNPLNLTVDNLLIYTTKDNHAAGFMKQSDSETFQGKYDWKDEKYYIRGHYAMGYTYLHCDLQSIGY